MTEPTRPCVLLTTPAYESNVHCEYMRSVLRLQETCREANVDLHVYVGPGSSLVPRARNQLATAFLQRPRYTHLLFVDADMSFEPDDIVTMLRFDRPIVGGLYYKKTFRTDRALESPWSVESLVPVPDPVPSEDGPFVRAETLGTGVLLIRRDALETLARTTPTYRTREDESIYLFFDLVFDPETREYHPEDTSFCRTWSAIGGELWLMRTFRATHHGTWGFGVRPSEFLFK